MVEHRPTARRRTRRRLLGPWVQAATFCECAIVDQDRMLSIVRVVDQIDVRASLIDGEPPSEIPPPEAWPPVDHALRFALRLFAGEFEGTASVRFEFVRPDGGRAEGPSLEVQFQQFRGINLIVPVRIGLRQPGCHWMRVLLNEQLLTQVPLIVVFHADTSVPVSLVGLATPEAVVPTTTATSPPNRGSE